MVEKKTESNYNNLPDFKIDKKDIPIVRVKSLRFENFKAFDDYSIDFTEGDGCRSFSCFIGPNGCGKTTILEAIQLIFSRFEGYDEDRIKHLLGKLVRHIGSVQKGCFGEEDFLITADIASSIGDYQVQINKNGFIKDHPEKIKMIVYRLCFYARFDQELNQFSLTRDKWNIFKDLFKAVTDFEIEEETNVFDQSDDPIQADILKEYVLSFVVKKPHEIIVCKECSDGEKKIIKCFSTLLNKEYEPQIILIDNVAMHIESGRHLELIKSMKKCFPESQLFTTTHSYNISRNIGKRSQIYDLRLINFPFPNESWRLILSDELKDCVFKLKSLVMNEKRVKEEILNGKDLIERCLTREIDDDLLRDSEFFLKNVSGLFIFDIYTAALKKNRL